MASFLLLKNPYSSWTKWRRTFDEVIFLNNGHLFGMVCNKIVFAINFSREVVRLLVSGFSNCNSITAEAKAGDLSTRRWRTGNIQVIEVVDRLAKKLASFFLSLQIAMGQCDTQIKPASDPYYWVHRRLDCLQGQHAPRLDYRRIFS